MCDCLCHRIWSVVPSKIFHHTFSCREMERRLYLKTILTFSHSPSTVKTTSHFASRRATLMWAWQWAWVTRTTSTPSPYVPPDWIIELLNWDNVLCAFLLLPTEPKDQHNRLLCLVNVFRWIFQISQCHLEYPSLVRGMNDPLQWFSMLLHSRLFSQTLDIPCSPLISVN